MYIEQSSVLILQLRAPCNRSIEEAEAEAPQDIDGQIKNTTAELERLSAMLESEDPATRQMVYDSLIESVSLTFATKKEGKREVYTVKQGYITLKQEAAALIAATSCKVGRGGQI